MEATQLAPPNPAYSLVTMRKLSSTICNLDHILLKSQSQCLRNLKHVITIQLAFIKGRLVSNTEAMRLKSEFRFISVWYDDLAISYKL